MDVFWEKNKPKNLIEIKFGVGQPKGVICWLMVYINKTIVKSVLQYKTKQIHKSKRTNTIQMNISITITGIILQKMNLCFVTENMSLITKADGEGNGNPLQYSCLENSTDRGAWRATVHGVARVGHDLATKSPPPPLTQKFSKSMSSILWQFSSLFSLLTADKITKLFGNP